ncbi:MAG TPA: tetratricopeptide repeat protein [Burkholderiales bacterium]
MSAAHDARGLEVTGASELALEHYERALEGLLAWTGEPRAEARRALEAAPGFTMGHLLEAHLHLTGRDPSGLDEARRALARAQALPQNARERAHAEAIVSGLRGDFSLATRSLAGILAQHPRDLLALAIAHTVDYMLGDAQSLRARVATALPAWSSADRGYAGVLAMLAFGLEEAGDYGRAEEVAFAALELEPRSLRAHHAQAHVLEMQGRAEEGVRWMGARTAYWTGAGASSTHLWWHLALYHLELGNLRHALEIHDRRIAAAATPSVNELIDASALLWRLQLRGIDPGARWHVLAERWAPRAEDAYCAVNDVHAMMAFVGADRRDLARRLLAAQRRRLATGGTNAGMLGVGLPASRSLAAFGERDYALAASLLRPLPEVAHKLGGSRAQRGLLGLTLRKAETRIRVAERRGEARTSPAGKDPAFAPFATGKWARSPIFQPPAAPAT